MLASGCLPVGLRSGPCPGQPGCDFPQPGAYCVASRARSAEARSGSQLGNPDSAWSAPAGSSSSGAGCGTPAARRAAAASPRAAPRFSPAGLTRARTRWKVVPEGAAEACGQPSACQSSGRPGLSTRFRLPPAGPAADFRQRQQAQDRAPRRPQRRSPAWVRLLLQQLSQRLQARRPPTRLRLLRGPFSRSRAARSRSRASRRNGSSSSIWGLPRLFHGASATARTPELSRLAPGRAPSPPTLPRSAGTEWPPARTSPGAPTPRLS